MTVILIVTYSYLILQHSISFIFAQFDFEKNHVSLLHFIPVTVNVNNLLVI